MGGKQWRYSRTETGIIAPQYKDQKQDASKQQPNQLLVTSNDFTLAKTKVSRCDRRLLLWFGRPKKNEGAEFQISKASLLGENVGERSTEDRTQSFLTAPEIS